MWGSAMCCKNQQPIALLLSYSQCGFADRRISRDSQVRVSGALLRSAHDTLTPPAYCTAITPTNSSTSCRHISGFEILVFGLILIADNVKGWFV